MFLPNYLRTFVKDRSVPDSGYKYIWHSVLVKARRMCIMDGTMPKTGIHPQYFPAAKVSCACGNAFTVGAAKPEIHVDICSKCHPFYTGEEKLIDTAGRVEKFKSRRTKAAEAPKKEKKVRAKKGKQTKKA